MALAQVLGVANGWHTNCMVSSDGGARTSVGGYRIVDLGCRVGSDIDRTETKNETIIYYEKRQCVYSKK